MKFDYNLLRGKIREVYKTEGNFAVRLGISQRTLSLKLNNKILFNQGDIDKILVALGLGDGNVEIYFFKKEVQKLELKTG